MGISLIVLTNFYPAALRALHYADALACAQGGRLVLLHVNRSSLYDLYMFAGEGWRRQELDRDADTATLLDRLATQLHTPATVELATDLLPEVAQDLVTRYQSGLFVVGLPAADHASPEQLSATTLDLLRAAQFPVLVVPDATPAAAQPRRVMVAVDQENFVLANAGAVIELLQNIKAEVTVVHVTALEDDAGCARALMHVQGSGLTKGVRSVDLRGFLHSDPAVGVLEAITQVSPDLVVVLSRSRNYLGGLFHHSVTAHVIARSPVPVLVLPVN
ncbi:universal stress protein [Hymenobacter sp. BT188]|uniref:universal stress protein n=1 Tax=Hymenobacter sp. BT188 TaxID=2763504 RepID=UPI00165174B7|nr:universal stress protein [Hymenobacter sp. BT188]MBC6605883.1 universal stress protein [Hymenobacter sp. BT188]